MASTRRIKEVIVIPSSSPSPVLLPSGSKDAHIFDGSLDGPDVGLALPEPPQYEIEMQDLSSPEEDASFFSLDATIASILLLFPDIEPDHVKGLYETNISEQGPNITEFLANQLIESNGHYPKVKRGERSAKRKRERSPSEMTEQELDEKYASKNRLPPSIHYSVLSRKLLRNSFIWIPAAYINAVFNREIYLFPAYKALANDNVNYDFALREQPLFRKLARSRPKREVPQHVMDLDAAEMEPEDHANLKDELAAAVRLFGKMTGRGGEAPGRAVLASEELFECQCCFSEVGSAQLTQCVDGHLFCLDCGKRNASNEIGKQKYKLLCMDSSGCRKEFPAEEVKKFCDEKMLETLERLEQRDILRKAEIEGLSECPFCDFAAIVPPVEIDREFRCQDPDCMTISCRLCNKATHVPLTCEENAKEENQNLRRNVEEAMTEALLRKCGKCGLPYVKESGCNKIICTRCSSMNCYLCSKVIKDYKHFNDPNRGGKVGNCLLFDNTEERHHNEVQAAEQAAIAKIRAENPEITEEEMRIQLSQVVLEGERRKIEDGNRRFGIGGGPPGLLIHPPRPIAIPIQPNLPQGAAQWPNPQLQPLIQPIPQVFYHPAQMPAQPMMQMMPGVAVPPFPGIPNGPPGFPHMLRNPMIQAPIQVPQMPILGNPVPFMGGPANMAQNINQMNQQPLNLFQRVQRVANLIPRPLGFQQPQGVPAMAPVPIVPNIPNQMPYPIYNQPIAVQNPIPQVPAPENPGFIQRNFNLGGNRLVRGRQPVRVPAASGSNHRPLAVLNDNNARLALEPPPDAAANIKPVPVSPIRHNRPAKIAKKR
ncbi:hypothetical protein TWF694_009190 [Orbilia ellipsospora]|uniref:RING-type domain-containing protein n=1 Tax=Orbilia ellipsospora TaxID=2528407 RepID=A0AAV9XEM7_9PEZI